MSEQTKTECSVCQKEISGNGIFYTNFDKEEKLPMCFSCCDHAETEHDFPDGLPYTDIDRQIDEIHGE